jgi:hypothetical protein
MPGVALDELVLTENDLNVGRAEVEGISSVARWIKKGKPVEDVEIEVENAFRCATYSVSFQGMLARLSEKYGTDKRKLVSHLLNDIAAR